MVRVLHLSDTHVSATGPDEDGVDAVASLERVLRDVGAVPDLDLVVVSGDVADDGSAEGCAAVRERVGAFAAARGVPHVYSTGNHDARAAFTAALGTGHLAAGGADRGVLLAEGSDRRAAVSDVDGLRVITLDSLVPGHTHGLLGDEQLGWLARELAMPARRRTLLVLHHPPLRLASVPFVETVVLQDIEALAAVVRGSDVRAILTGHLHFRLSGSLAGVPVWVTPGVVTRIDTTAAPHLVRGVLGAGATVVELPDAEEGDTGHGAPTFHVLHARDPRAGEEVYVYDAATGADVDEARGDVGPDERVEVGGRRFSIGRARREDVAGIVALLADDPLGRGRESAPDDVYLAAFAAVDRDPAQLLVAVRDEGGSLVATMQLTFVPGLSRGGATRLQVEAVRVGEAARGRGLGAAMLEWAHEVGRRRGATLAQLTTDKTRADAHRFYAALGYVASHEGLKRSLED